MESIGTFEMVESALFEYSGSLIPDRILQAYEKYKQLGMTNVLERVREGAVAFVLGQMNLRFIRATQQMSGAYFLKPDYKMHSIPTNEYHLDLVDTEGNYTSISWDKIAHRHWEIVKLKDYDKPIPFDILKDLPIDAGEKASIFYPPEVAKDPILAYPIPYKGEVLHKKLPIYDYDISFWGNELWKVKGSVMAGGSVKTYWAAVYRWE